MRRGLSVATVLLSVLAVTAACGDDGDDGGDDGGNTETKTIEVTVKDGVVSPAGERVDLAVDQPVDIVITSDEAGELHVHSSPESTKEFEAGENAPIELTFDRPGLVDVELHEPFEGPVVQLQVK